MDAANYYITTLTNAAKTLGPWIVFLIGGYLLFIKMPFLFLKKSMDTQKKKLQDENKGLVGQKSDYSLEDYQAFQRKMKLLKNEAEEKAQGAKSDKKQERPHQEKKQEAPRKEQRKEQKKEEVKKSSSISPYWAEEILGFKPNEPFTQAELKKRYFDLLKQNHPDRVASMGNDFKKLAEKNTKDLNQAYDKLKKRAA
jgi:hypothetical protein